MVTVEQVAAIAGSLPEVTVGERWGNRTWLVDGKCSRGSGRSARPT